MANTPNTIPSTNAAQPRPFDTNEVSIPRERPGVGVAITDSATPNDPTTEEATVARFPSPTDAEQVVNELTAAGIARDQISILSDPAEKREFMTRYIRRDSDRHSHSSVSSAFFALGGAFTLGLLAVVVGTPFGMMAAIIGAIVGGIVGALLGAVLGKIAMRPADDRSMEVVDALANEGTLLAIRHPSDTASSLMTTAGKILSRHNTNAIRLRPHLSLADLHPGDTRSSKVVEPLDRQPRS